MNNPLQPISDTPGGSHPFASASPEVLSQESALKPPQPLPQRPSPTKRSLLGAGEAGKKKVGFFGKLFGAGKSQTKSAHNQKVVTRSSVGEEASLSLPGKSTESEAMLKRHEELIKSVDDICKSLEATKSQKVEVSVSDMMPPFPTDNLDALTRTQVQVGGVLEKVAGRLDEAGKRDGLVMDSLTRVDGTLAALSRASDRSVTTMDGMKGIFAQVSGSMESVRTELKKSGRRYEELCEKVRNTDQENAETIAKLQKRTLLVTVLLGVALVAGLIIVGIGS
jgi:hypothetical protein